MPDPIEQTSTSVLIACASGEFEKVPPLVETLAEVGGMDRLVDLALAHRVAGILLGSVPSSAADNPHMKRLRLRLIATATSQLAAHRGLVGITSALTNHDIAPLVVKGPVLANRLYASPVQRPFSDLDLVIPAASFRSATTILRHAGYRILDRNWPLILSERRAQLHLASDSGLVIDLHWHLLNRGIVRDSFTVPMNELFERRRTVQVRGAAVTTLDVEDSLLHLCLHAALGGGQLLLWSADIARLIEREPVDWDVLVKRASAWGARRPVGIALWRSRVLAAALVPTEVLEHVGMPGRRQQLFGLLDRWWPPLVQPPGRSPQSILTAAARDTTTSTMTALMRRAKRWTTNHGPGVTGDAAEAASVGFGDYINWVESVSN